MSTNTTTPLMKRKATDIVQDVKITENVESFLDKCSPSYGNIVRNKITEESEFVGYARLEDGTPVKILGMTKEGKNNETLMPIRIVMISPDDYNNKSTFVPSYKTKETRDFLSGKRDSNY